ncbi:MAG: hypothetical protein WCA10_17090 [Terracidiphilus sp.]
MAALVDMYLAEGRTVNRQQGFADHNLYDLTFFLCQAQWAGNAALHINTGDVKSISDALMQIASSSDTRRLMASGRGARKNYRGTLSRRDTFHLQGIAERDLTGHSNQ